MTHTNQNRGALHKKSLIKIAVILLLTLSSGCSVLQLGYDHGRYLAWWWMNSYVDFSRAQKPHVKQAIHQWFGWHRNAQLPEYAAWLSTVRGQINDPLTPAQICRWSEELQDMVAPALDYAVHLSVPVVLSLDEAQVRHLERRYIKSNNKLRKKYLQPNHQDRLNASIKRTVKRIENFYGDIDEEQRNFINASIENSPFNPDAWLSERRRRQQVTLSTLRQLVTGSMSAEQAATELRKLLEHTYRSDDPQYRTYQMEINEYSCHFIAQMHNTATSHQRQHLHDKLKSWEDDLRVLTGDYQVYSAIE